MENSKKMGILISIFISNIFLFNMNAMPFDSWKNMKKYLPSFIQKVIDGQKLNKGIRWLRLQHILPKDYSGVNQFESENFDLDDNKVDISKLFENFLEKNNIYWENDYAPGWALITRKYQSDIPRSGPNLSSDNVFKIHLQIKVKYLYDFIKDFLNNFIYPQGSFCQMNVAGIKAPEKIKIISKNKNIIEFANYKKELFEKSSDLKLSDEIDKNAFEKFIDNKYGKGFYEKRRLYDNFEPGHILNDYFYKQHIVRKVATIVIYLAKSPQFIYKNKNLRQTYLNSFVMPISDWINSWAKSKNLSLSDIALDVEPRFNLKINDVVYIAGGNGDEKNEIIQHGKKNPFDDDYIFIKNREYEKDLIPEFNEKFIELRKKEANDLIRCIKSNNFENISEYDNYDEFHEKLFLEFLSELTNIGFNMEKYNNTSFFDESPINPLYKVSSLFRSFLVFYNGDNKKELISSFYDFIKTFF